MIKNNMCLFCQIVNDEIKTEKIFEDAEMIAIDDIHPKAPVHFLVIPKKHLKSLNDCQTEDNLLLGKMLERGKILAEKKGILIDGYKVVINIGENGGQVIQHLHIHFLGGKNLTPNSLV